MRIKQPEIETALKIYYSHTEIGNAEIKKLYGGLSPSTIVKLKNKARKKMIEDDMETWNPNSVATKSAYIAWGIDIQKFEQNYTNLKKLGLT